MKPAALVSDGASLGETLGELRTLNAKVFATPKACEILEAAGTHAIPLADPLGVARIFSFGHKEIHLFGFDLCVADTEGSRVCIENRVFHTTPDLATHAHMLLRACVELTGRGAQIAVHGNGMFAHMAATVQRNSAERVLTAVYDMQVCPPTYEVFSFFSEAEKFRRERGFTAIDVVFQPGPMHGFRDDGLPPSVPERVSMLHRICVSGARLLPSVRNVHVLRSRIEIEGAVFPPDWTNERPTFLYGPRFQNNGLRCLRATDAARNEVKRRFPKPYTTITLREAEYWPERNSNMDAWASAARELMVAGIPAVVVPDTHGESLPDVARLATAAWDIDLRMALYEGAVLNLGVANGPMALLHLAAEKCPYLMFQRPAEGTATPQAFLDAQGVSAGDQWSQNGLTIWQEDTPENVVGALKDWLKREQERAA